MSAQKVQIQDERIMAVKNWPKPKLLRDIQVFLDFANFYWRFIQNFGKIVRLLTLMLRTSQTQLAKNSSLLIDVAENAEIGVDDNDHEDEMSEKLPRSKNLNGAMSYLSRKARLAVTQLRQAFIKAQIL